jgi:hypothetical protein
MKTFIIDADNNITAVTEKEAAAANGAEAFGSEKELQRIAAQWPGERLVEVWNSIPGVKAVTRFTNRKAGVARVWKAIQGLAMAAVEPEPAAGTDAALAKVRCKKAPKATATAATVAKTAKAGKAANSGKAAKPARDGSKKAEVVEMMQRKGGCTLAEIMNATGWKAHTVRAFVSGTLGKKMGLVVTSTKNDQGERTYSLPR